MITHQRLRQGAAVLGAGGLLFVAFGLLGAGPASAGGGGGCETPYGGGGYCSRQSGSEHEASSYSESGTPHTIPLHTYSTPPTSPKVQRNTRSRRRPPS